MASKKYAYYNRGNKIAIVEQSATTSSGKMAVAHCTISGYDNITDCEAAGGQWIPGSSGSIDSFGEYTSPVETIPDGLEIEYSYIPTHRVNTAANQINNTYYSNGWFVLDGYLSFVRGAKSSQGVANWLTSMAVTGSEGDSGGQTLDYIFVTGSSRWNGVHRVQTAGGAFGTLGGGILKTYTKASPIGPYRYGVDLDVAVNETIFDGGGSPAITLGDDGYKVGDFVHISGFDGTAKNNGVFKVSSVTPSGTATDSTLGFDVRYHMPSGNSTTPETEVTDTSMQFVAEADAASNLVSIAKIEHEISLITTNVEVLNDESFELDVTRGQAKAIVFYMKSMQAEERQDIETREYFMALFRTELGRIASARKHGHYIASGHWNMI